MLLVLRTLSKVVFSGKIIRFLTEKRKGSGFQLWACQVKVTIIREGTFSSSTFFSTLWIKANRGNAYRLLNTISVQEHLCQDRWDPAFKSNNLEADLTTLKQTGIFLFSSPIFGIFCRKLKGTVSILRNLSGTKIPNLPCNLDSLAVIMIPCPSRNFQNFLWDLHYFWILCPSHFSTNNSRLLCYLPG